MDVTNSREEVVTTARLASCTGYQYAQYERFESMFCFNINNVFLF